MPSHYRLAITKEYNQDQMRAKPSGLGQWSPGRPIAPHNVPQSGQREPAPIVWPRYGPFMRNETPLLFVEL